MFTGVSCCVCLAAWCCTVVMVLATATDEVVFSVVVFFFSAGCCESEVKGLAIKLFYIPSHSRRYRNWLLTHNKPFSSMFLGCLLVLVIREL